MNDYEALLNKDCRFTLPVARDNKQPKETFNTNKYWL